MGLKESIDCIILPLEDKNYLLPAAAVAEVLSFHSQPAKSPTVRCMGIFPWRDISLSLFLPHLTTKSVNDLYHPKVAIIKAVDATCFPAYFALLFEGKAQKIKLTSEEITWKSTAEREIQIAKKGVSIQAVLPDLKLWWQEIGQYPS